MALHDLAPVSPTSSQFLPWLIPFQPHAPGVLSSPHLSFHLRRQLIILMGLSFTVAFSAKPSLTTLVFQAGLLYVFHGTCV